MLLAVAAFILACGIILVGWRDARATAKLTAEVNELTKEVGRLAAGAPATAPSADEKRAFFNECGQWARHYSTVRMTLFTFLTGLSIAIVSFAWGKAGEKSAVKLAGIVLVLMLALVYIFSHSYDQWKLRQETWYHDLKGNAADTRVREGWLSPVHHLPFLFALAVVVILIAAGYFWLW